MMPTATNPLPLREDIRQMLSGLEARIVTRIKTMFYRAFFALALFLLILYGTTIGLMIALFG